VIGTHKPFGFTFEIYLPFREQTIQEQTHNSDAFDLTKLGQALSPYTSKILLAIRLNPIPMWNKGPTSFIY